MKTKKNAFILLSIFIVVIFILHTSLNAQDNIKIAETLEKVLPDKEKKENEKLYDDWGDNFIKALKFLKAAEEERRALDLSVELGFNGNKAGGENNLYKLNIGTEVRKGGFRNEFRFKAETSILYEDDELKENVTTMLVNYDYYLLPFLETYGFVERFSNSYLSIQQRYEIGIGFKLEREFGTTRKKNKELAKYNKESSGAYKKFKEYIKKLPVDKKTSEEKKYLYKQLDELESGEKDVLKFFKKKYAKFAAGIAMSIFAELERAELKTTVTEIDEPNGNQGTILTKEFYPSDQLLRGTIRPSVTYRPTEYLTLDGMIYYKFRLDPPRKINNNWDYRIDGLLRAKVKMLAVSGWAKKVSLIFEYRYHYDNIPPELSVDIINEYKVMGKELTPVEAEKNHHEFIFKLNVQF